MTSGIKDIFYEVRDYVFSYIYSLLSRTDFDIRVSFEGTYPCS